MTIYHDSNNTLGHYSGNKVLKQMATRFGELRQVVETLARNNSGN